METTIQCTKYFSYHLTRRGDYLVRAFGHRDIGRFSTEEEARQLSLAEQGKNEAAAAEREIMHNAQEAFNASVPSLNKMQLEWQRWRNEFYGALMYENKRVNASRRALDRIPEERASTSPTYPGHERRCSENEQEIYDAHQRYNRAVQLDSALKQARREKNIEALTAALHEAMAFAQTVPQVGMLYAHPPTICGEVHA